MRVVELGLSGLQLVSPERHQDSRGWFTEAFNQEAFAKAGLPSSFVQDNQSFSNQGVLRGMHCQVRKPQGKLIRVLSGRIWDVVVDLRRDSKTLGQSFGLELRPRNEQGELEMLWIPEGFAHGFLVLSECAEVLYKVTRPYDPGGEQTLLWNDPALGIEWPLHRLPEQTLVVSPKDAAGLRLSEADLF